MNFLFILQILQIICSILLTVLVLIQSKGTGLYSGVGNSIGFYRSRRGLEKGVFIFSIIVTLILVVNSVILVLFS